MVRYADDFDSRPPPHPLAPAGCSCVASDSLRSAVILCRPGQGERIQARTQRWLESRGLKLNEAKTRRVNIREKHASMSFLGYTLNYRTSPRTRRSYPHVEPSAKAQASLREKVREVLNRSTTWRAPETVVAELNVKIRGWKGYYHYANSSGVFGKLNRYISERLARWHWRKPACSGSLWTRHKPSELAERYRLYQLPLKAAWLR